MLIDQIALFHISGWWVLVLIQTGPRIDFRVVATKTLHHWLFCRVFIDSIFVAERSLRGVGLEALVSVGAKRLSKLLVLPGLGVVSRRWVCSETVGLMLVTILLVFPLLFELIGSFPLCHSLTFATIIGQYR